MTIEELDRRYYPDLVDEQVLFDEMIRSYLRPDSVVLDAGAGRGLRFPYDYRRHVARMAGADVDPAVLDNPNLTDAVVADLAQLPYGVGEFDVVFSKFVFEHLEQPLAVMRELRRVTKRGGRLLIHTPNRWHYVTVAAALTPVRVHVWYTKKLGQDEADTFPTQYKVNEPKTIRRLASRSGFRVASLDLLETKPGYLTLHPLAYRAGIVYERLVNRFEALARFRVTLLVDLEAVGGSPDAP